MSAVKFPDPRYPYDPRLDSVLRNIAELYDCPHCGTVVPKGGALHVVNAGTQAERRYCSARCRFEGRPVFTIFITRKRWVKPCDARLAEEKKGMVGWHRSDTCPDCVKWDDGFELWGENNHLQGHTREMPDEAWLSSYKLRHGSRLNIRFVDEGHSFTYLASQVPEHLRTPAAAAQ